VRIVYRHMPLAMHPDAELAAEAAVAAAAQGKFWPFHDKLFADQRHLARPDLDAAAKAVGLDVARFDQDLDSGRWRDAVADDAAAGSSIGVAGTPTLFVNGSPIDGAVDYDTLKVVVEARLDEAHSLIAHGLAKGDVYATVMNAAAVGEHGDPSRMPSASGGVHLELRQDDREAAVEAACRARDGARAGEMAKKLKQKALASEVCSAYGIDL
jgi:hypothetical protein